MKYVTITQVLQLHDKMIRETGGDGGIRDHALLESALYNALSTFDGKELYPSLEEKCANICFCIVNIETNFSYDAILHHFISIYGEPCKSCGKPLRTPRAKYCAACGTPSDNENSWYCTAVGRVIESGLCWEYCFARSGGPADIAYELERWIETTVKFKDLNEFHGVCGSCVHCQWRASI